MTSHTNPLVTRILLSPNNRLRVLSNSPLQDRSNCKALKNPNMKTRLVGLKENKTIDDENRETPVEVSTVEHQTIDLVATNTSTSSSSEVDCSVFRRTSSLDDTTDDTGIESMWTLKRANTFFDEDEDCSSSSDESPLKRLRSNTVLRHDIQTKYAPTTSFNFANNNVFRLELNGTSGQFHIS